MSKLQIEVSDYTLAQAYGSQIWAGNAFAFIAASPANQELQAGLENFYGIPPVVSRRTLPLVGAGQQFPGFTVKTEARPLKIAPVLLTDKEIYRAGQDNVRLLLGAPLLAGQSNVARVVIENNGAIYRAQNVTLEAGGLTLVDLGKLPEGNYRVYWDGEEAQDYQGDKAECRFSSVEYVLSPLQATLLGHELREKRLACRLKVERFNEPLNAQVQIELWSGNQRLGHDKVKPVTPGIYNAEFKVKASAEDRLELRVSYLDQLATAVIPGSRKTEREETLLSSLGREVQVSLMPRRDSREVRGLYLSEAGPVNNSPVTIQDPAPTNRKTQVRWLVAAEAARLLVLDMGGKVVLNKDLGAVSAGQVVEIEVPGPGGWLAVGGWLGEKAWEGWSSLLAPSQATLEIAAPSTARPGQEIEVQLRANSPASIYLLVRDTRLAGSGPQERLAAAIKRGLEGATKWGENGFVKHQINAHPDWPSGYYPYGGGFNTATVYARGITMPPPMVPMPMSAPPPPTGMAPRMMASAARPFGSVAKNQMAFSMQAQADFDQEGLESMTLYETASAPTGSRVEARRDFADVAFCAVVKTDSEGRASQKVKLPDAITTYGIEAFALSQDGADWVATRESLEVSQPVWAEFKLPAFVYPGDNSPATLEIGCAGGQFRLRLLCDGVPLTFKLEGAKLTGPGTFAGNRAKVSFEAYPGQWRVELEDLTTGEKDSAERTVQAIGQFKALAKRFQLLSTGETLTMETAQAIQFRLLPSLDKPFSLLCDATTNYEHKCCEQTAAKLIASIAAWMSSGNDQNKLREVITAGVAREKRMFVPGRGFMMYPAEESGGSPYFNEHWGKQAAEHLSSLAFSGQSVLAGGGDPVVIQALREAIELGQAAAKVYKLTQASGNISDGQAAYRAVVEETTHRNEALRYARKTLTESENQPTQPSVRLPYGAVQSRAERAYCAAALLLGGDHSDLGLALKAANRLAANLDSNGRLYSTVDSVAFVSLMAALKARGIGAGNGGRVKLDGRELPLAEALEIAEAGQSREVMVLDGVALVELTTEITEDWNAFRAEVPVSLQLNRTGRIVNRGLRLGDTLELVVKIQQYEAGQLVHVCLPSALSRIEGGGEVKKFTVDFCGKTEVNIPLRATGYTLPGGEHWAVLVRNMFQEEQAGNPGVQLVQVSAD